MTEGLLTPYVLCLSEDNHLTPTESTAGAALETASGHKLGQCEDHCLINPCLVS